MFSDMYFISARAVHLLLEAGSVNHLLSFTIYLGLKKESITTPCFNMTLLARGVFGEPGLT